MEIVHLALGRWLTIARTIRGHLLAATTDDQEKKRKRKLLTIRSDKNHFYNFWHSQFYASNSSF